MKNYLSASFTAGAILFVILMASFGGGSLKNSGGAPAGNTNSPGDGQNCTHCMGGTALQVTGWITSDVPSTGYVPGTSYTITVTATGTGKKGFEVSPQDVSGNLIGTLTAGTGTKLVGSNKYVTHNAAKSGNPSTWSFLWTPPAGGAGDVVFYGSIIVSLSNTKITTLTVSQSTVGLTEYEKPVVSVFPNPATDMITVSFTLDSPQDVDLHLLNVNGERKAILVQESFPAGKSTRSFAINQPAGIYFIHMSVAGKNYLTKLIIGS